MVEIEISPAIFQRKLQNDEIQMMKNLVGGDWNYGILWLSIQLGMSSSQLTKSIIFWRGIPPTSNVCLRWWDGDVFSWHFCAMARPQKICVSTFRPTGMTQNCYELVSEKRVPSISMDCIIHYSYLLYIRTMYIYRLIIVIPVNIVQFLCHSREHRSISGVYHDVSHPFSDTFRESPDSWARPWKFAWCCQSFSCFEARARDGRWETGRWWEP